MTCYVPFCESALPSRKGAKREPGISFHQFPLHEELRKKWIIAIGRKDPKTGAYWNPHVGATVCSLHFSPKQFRTSSTKCVLKYGSIPFIFPDYSLPERGTLISEDQLSSLKLIPFPSTVNSGNTSRRSKSVTSQSSSVPETSTSNDTKKAKNKKRTSSEMNSSETDNDEIRVDKVCPTTPKFKIMFVSFNKNQKLASPQPQKNNNFAPKTPPPLIDLTTDTSHASPEISVVSSPATHQQDTEENIPTTSTSAPHLKSPIQNTVEKLIKEKDVLKAQCNAVQNKNCLLVNRVLKLQKENESLKLKNEIIQQKLELFHLEALEKGLTSENAKALFLYDQLCSFAKEECTWSKSTMDFVKSLEKNFPTCYDFLKYEDVISLPSPTSNLDTCTE